MSGRRSVFMEILMQFGHNWNERGMLIIYVRRIYNILMSLLIIQL